MAKRDGYDVLLTLAGTKVSGVVTHGLEMVWDMLESTSKDSLQLKEYLSGESGWTLSIEGLVDEETANNITYLKTTGDARTPVAAIIGRLRESTAKAWSGNVLVSALSFTATKNEVWGYSATLQGTGALTEATVVTTLA
jgi:predicted secreted protein